MYLDFLLGDVWLRYLGVCVGLFMVVWGCVCVISCG